MSVAIGLKTGGRDHDQGAVDRRVAAIAAALADRLTEVSKSIEDHIYAEHGDVDGDSELARLREASVAGSLETVLQVLRLGLCARDVEPPPIAVEYVRRLAQRGLPISLLRCSTAGPEDFLAQAFALMDQQPSAQDTDASRRIASVVFEYNEEKYRRLVEVYQAERDQWVSTHHASRLASILGILNARDVPVQREQSAFEAAVGYHLNGKNVGLVVWRYKPSTAAPAAATLERFASQLSVVVEAADHLVVPWDSETVWMWLAGRGIAAPTSDQVATAVARTRGLRGDSIRVASGTIGVGVEGFRVTHDQALQARSVALAARDDGPTLTRYEDVGALALLQTDPERAAAWTRQVLGRLVDPNKNSAMLRETLRVFLRQGGSFTSAAALLNVHPNTVKYRVDRAQDLLGRPIVNGRLDIELALFSCDWFGVPTAIARSTTSSSSCA